MAESSPFVSFIFLWMSLLMMLLFEEEEIVNPGNVVGDDDAFTLLVLVANTGLTVELLVGDMVDAAPWRIFY